MLCDLDGRVRSRTRLQNETTPVRIRLQILLMSDNEDYIDCERCERDVLKSLSEVLMVGDAQYVICDGCAEDIITTTENYYWYDRYTKEHHEKAVEALESRDEVWCVQHWYDGGEIIVHTPYVSSAVVQDVAEHFDLNVYACGPRWEKENGFNCDHGDCFEFFLDVHSNMVPLPVTEDVRFTDIEWLDDNDKQF